MTHLGRDVLSGLLFSVLASLSDRGFFICRDTFRWVEICVDKLADWEPLEAKEIYMNQVKMEAANFKHKKQGTPAKDEDDPDYVNINLTCRNWGQSKSNHSPPKNQAPTRPRPPADSAQVPRWLHGAILTLYVLVALCCITVAASVLVKHSALSQELLDLKRELGNISASVGQCQEEQLQNRNAIQLSFQEAKTLMHIVKNNIQDCCETLKTLSSDIRQIKVKLQDISKKQETKPEPAQS